ncbi:MAG: ribonuclease H family protein [Lachnospiraceae bacterium]|nr:ribonuclease H family protein [Lachnospiraceae bacterium]
MAAKKYYAVKKGKSTGIFNTWEECRACVDGYSGAEYKGFATMEEARSYMGTETSGESQQSKRMYHTESVHRDVNTLTATESPQEGTLLAYVDGSYQDALKKYAFGCVFILPDGSIYTEFGNGDNPESLQQRNVTGEMLGAMYAVKTAMKNGFRGIEIRYDYEGIEKWVTGAWRSKTELTRQYAQAMREWGQQIAITFTKVPAHSNVYFNELADSLAKQGLEQGEGVPKFQLFSEMTKWNQSG